MNLTFNLNYISIVISIIIGSITILTAIAKIMKPHFAKREEHDKMTLNLIKETQVNVNNIKRQLDKMARNSLKDDIAGYVAFLETQHIITSSQYYRLCELEHRYKEFDGNGELGARICELKKKYELIGQNSRGDL